MNLVEAKALAPNESVYDSEGTKFTFIGLDDQNDLIVECRAAINGRIYLDRAMCTRDNPKRLGSEYDCDHCDEYVPDGDGRYVDKLDARLCDRCYIKYTFK